MKKTRKPIKRSRTERVLLTLLVILWLGMAVLYWPVALVFLLLVAVQAPGKRATEKLMDKFRKDGHDQEP
ncbi:MAG: hypothetical protein KDI17_06165 [Halioglobus sp.]|nr:hypothetical protein [Halioglobus sp.]